MTPRRRFSRRGALRVAAFFAVVNLSASAMYLPRARAAAEHVALSRGLDVLRQLGPILNESEQAMAINGQRMFFSSRTTSLAPNEVLSRVEQDCRDHSGGLGEKLSKLPATLNGAEIPETLRDPARWLTVREDDAAAGQVTCFVPHDKLDGFQGFVQRVSAFAKSGELAELGDARYVVARRSDDTGLTHVLAMWTEGSFNVLSMFPAEGDAPGSDSPHVPRPHDSVRVLSAEPPDRPYALRMYDSARTPSAVLAEYSEVMVARGWSSVTLPQNDAVDLNDSTRAFSKEGRAAVVVVQTTSEEKSFVTLIEMGNTGFARSTSEPLP